MILSDVEETVHTIEIDEETEEEHNTVSMPFAPYSTKKENQHCLLQIFTITPLCGANCICLVLFAHISITANQAQYTHAFCSWRWCYSSFTTNEDFVRLYVCNVTTIFKTYCAIFLTTYKQLFMRKIHYYTNKYGRI